ncbi:MAG: hypothetical protein U5R06_03295 [candidate division KSB1 bacterium]|nr:hypothetical protein [candidate division KSB1 bacterium]
MAYFSLYNDTTFETGLAYDYRARAVNESGVSEPSKPVGPVSADSKTMVDELLSFGNTYFHKGDFTFESKQARQTKEDLNRLTGKPGSELVYYVPGFIRRLRAQRY